MKRTDSTRKIIESEHSLQIIRLPSCLSTLGPIHPPTPNTTDRKSITAPKNCARQTIANSWNVSLVLNRAPSRHIFYPYSTLREEGRSLSCLTLVCPICCGHSISCRSPGQSRRALSRDCFSIAGSVSKWGPVLAYRVIFSGDIIVNRHPSFFSSWFLSVNLLSVYLLFRTIRHCRFSLSKRIELCIFSQWTGFRSQSFVAQTWPRQQIWSGLWRETTAVSWRSRRTCHRWAWSRTTWQGSTPWNIAPWPTGNRTSASLSHHQLTESERSHTWSRMALSSVSMLIDVWSLPEILLKLNNVISLYWSHLFRKTQVSMFDTRWPNEDLRAPCAHPVVVICKWKQYVCPNQSENLVDGELRMMQETNRYSGSSLRIVRFLAH